MLVNKKALKRGLVKRTDKNMIEYSLRRVPGSMRVCMRHLLICLQAMVQGDEISASFFRGLVEVTSIQVDVTERETSEQMPVSSMLSASKRDLINDMIEPVT